MSEGVQCAVVAVRRQMRGWGYNIFWFNPSVSDERWGSFCTLGGWGVSKGNPGGWGHFASNLLGTERAQ
eukprot:757088-Hanusia_phi.AAC.5